MAQKSIVQDLFEFCLSTFSSVVTLAKSTATEDDDKDDLWAETSWKEEKDRLVLWGDGFDIERGELDRILSTKESEHLRKSVVMLLGTMAGSLARGM